MWDNFQCQTHFLLLFKRRKWFKIIIICRSRNTKMAIAMIFKRTFISVQVFMFYLDLKCSQSQDKAICRFNYIVMIIIPRLIINMTYYWNDNKSFIFVHNVFADFHSAVMKINWIPKLISVEVRNKLSRNHLSQEC